MKNILVKSLFFAAITSSGVGLSWAQDFSNSRDKNASALTVDARRKLLHAVIKNQKPIPAPAEIKVFEYFVYRSYPWGKSGSASFTDIVNAYPYSSNITNARLQLKTARENFQINALPQSFIMGDGTLFRPFIYVNRAPRSPLSLALDEITRQILQLYGLSKTQDVWPETILNFLAQQTQDYLPFPRQMPQGTSPLIGINVLEESKLRASLLDKKPGASSLPFKNYRHTSEPFESILLKGEGICLDMVILASMLLERFEVPHRVVHGSVVSDNNYSQKSGHSWIELKDGRILDVAWKTLAPPDLLKRHSYHQDWKFFGNEKGSQFRFAYESYPILVLEP